MEEQLLESKKQKVVKHAIFLPVCVAFILWVLWLFVLARDENEILKGYYQVEITGVEAASSGFFLPGGGGAQPEAATSPRFNITAHVINRHRKEQVFLESWNADVSYAGIPLGSGTFPEICLEKMAETEVTVTTSTELVGLSSMPRFVVALDHSRWKVLSSRLTWRLFTRYDVLIA